MYIYVLVVIRYGSLLHSPACVHVLTVLAHKVKRLEFSGSQKKAAKEKRVIK